MKVLHLVRAMDVGGLESVVIGLVDGSRGLGIAPHLGCLYEFGALGNDVRVDGSWIGGLQDHGVWSTVWSLCRYIRENHIEIIHSHNPQPHLFAVLAGLFCRTPVVHTKHGRNYPSDSKRVWLNRQLSRFSKKIVAVSGDSARVAVEIEKVPAGKVTVILNGIDTGRFNRETRERHESRIVIGSVGRLSEDKDYPMLVRAFARCRSLIADLGSQTSGLRLLFVGDGPERGLIEEEARKEGVLELCEFAGMQSNVAEWLQRMDVFCLSSVTEGTSMTLLEAGGCGLPSVVTNVGGNGEIVANGKSGFVVPAGDEGAFGEALAKLVDDDSLRRRFGDAARKRVVERYSMESMVSQYVGVYEEILNRSKRR